MGLNRIAVGAAKELSVVAAGQLGNDCYDKKRSKHMFVLLSYSTDANLFRLSKGIAVRFDNSPLVEKGLLHEHLRWVKRYWTVGKVSSTRFFKPSRCELGRKIKQNTPLRVQHSN